jgi:methyl-accepting chemotaxis protein
MAEQSSEFDEPPYTANLDDVVDALRQLESSVDGSSDRTESKLDRIADILKDTQDVVKGVQSAVEAASGGDKDLTSLAHIVKAVENLHSIEGAVQDLKEELDRLNQTQAMQLGVITSRVTKVLLLIGIIGIVAILGTLRHWF